MNLNRTWDKHAYQEYIKYLFTYENIKQQNFANNLIPTKYKMIGIKNPDMIKIAKEILKGDYISFIENAKYRYFEEINITGLVIAGIKDKNTFLKYFNDWIKKIDNWASCDMVVCKIYLATKDESFFQYALELLRSKEEYVTRVGVIILMCYFLKDDRHIKDILSNIDTIDSQFYYINMAIAWLLSVAFIKHHDITLEYLKKNRLNKFTHNKAIQKCIESRRISDSDKEILRTLKKV